MTPRPRRLGFPITSLLFDLALLVCAERFAPLKWELPDDRLQVTLPLGVAALVGAFLVGGYRNETSLSATPGRSPAVRAGFGLVLGLVVAWLVLKLLSQKAGLRELIPPALEALIPTLLGLWTCATLQRVVHLAVLRRRARRTPIGLLSDDPALAARLVRDGFPDTFRYVAPAELSDEGLASVRALVIATPLAALSRSALEALAYARGVGLKVVTSAQFEEEVFGRVPLADEADPSLVLDGSLERRTTLYHSGKRLIDVVGAAVLLALTCVPLLVAAVCIRLESRGPVFYRQLRAGLYRRPFTLYKLRTMVADAEPDGPRFTSLDDTRVTRVGRFLRRTRMDELPQLVNILKNEMSLVGPRPERPEHDRHLAPLIPYYALRNLTKPGLTGWAQVRVGYSDSPERARHKLEHDLYYLKHASLGFDLAILAATVGVVVRMGGR